MKTLKNSFSIIAVLFLTLMGACKKDKEIALPNTGSISYQNRIVNFRGATYRNGDNNGAWIYLNASEVGFAYTLQIRFSEVGDAVIPIRTFTLEKVAPYDPKFNFNCGKVTTTTANNEFADELTAGSV